MKKYIIVLALLLIITLTVPARAVKTYYIDNGDIYSYDHKPRLFSEYIEYDGIYYEEDTPSDLLIARIFTVIGFLSIYIAGAK